MKKIFLGLATIALILTGCESDQSPNLEEQDNIDMSDFYVYTDADMDEGSRLAANKKSCYSMVHLNRQLNENPGLYQKMYDIEKNTRKFINAKKPTNPGGGNGNGGGGGDNGGGGDPPTSYADVTIKVYVNILEQFPGQVTDDQIRTQIAILNEDFNANNPNTSGVPTEFADLISDTNINFTHASGDVMRVVDDRDSWGTSNAMKDPSRGGIAPTSPSDYMNIWVCEIGGGILGYAQFPGGSPETDGVVIGTDYFGESAAGGVYGDGRTGTHEVGHYLNLRHIWGDGRCRQDDFVADTPTSDSPNYGCPDVVTKCKSRDMTMNFMDYVYDDCMYMYTHGQNDRMQAVLASGGQRARLVGR